MLSPKKRMLLEERLKIIEERLENYRFAEETVTRGAQGYTVGSNQKQNASLNTISREIDKLLNEKMSIMLQLNGESNRGIIRVQPTMD